MSLIDYNELVCRSCGHIGLLPDGDFDVVCPECDDEYSLIDEYHRDDEEDEDDL